MSDPHKLKRGKRLDAWIEANGGAVACLIRAGYEQGTKEFKSRESYLSACRKVGMGHTAALNFESQFGMNPGTLTNNLDEDGGAPVRVIAQNLSALPHQTPLIRWEELMSVQLPDVFRVQLRDDALAPRLLAGDELVFKRASNAKAGQLVLLREPNGNHLARVIKERLPGQLVAYAPNPAFEPLDVEALNLEIVGVLIYQSPIRTWGDL